MVRKVTFTLDDETIRRLQNAAERAQNPNREVVREAIADYHERIGRLGEAERRRMLKVFDEFVTAIPRRSRTAVDAEIADVRHSRRESSRRRR